VPEALFGASGGVLQARYEHESVHVAAPQLGLGPELFVEPRGAFLRTTNPKRELILVDEAVGIAVDRAGNGLLDLGNLRFYRVQIRVNLGSRRCRLYWS
jgi:hypothetical protein